MIPVKILKELHVQVKKRFPTLGHMEEAGIITENERKIIEGLDEKCIQVSFSPTYPFPKRLQKSA